MLHLPPQTGFRPGEEPRQTILKASVVSPSAVDTSRRSLRKRMSDWTRGGMTIGGAGGVLSGVISGTASLDAAIESMGPSAPEWIERFRDDVLNAVAQNPLDSRILGVVLLGTIGLTVGTLIGNTAARVKNAMVMRQQLKVPKGI